MREGWLEVASRRWRAGEGESGEGGEGTSWVERRWRRNDGGRRGRPGYRAEQGKQTAGEWE